MSDTAKGSVSQVMGPVVDVCFEQGELPSERVNVRGLDRPQVLRERIAALFEEQRRLSPTRTTEIEDPSYGDQTLTANELAYNRDAQAFRNR